MRTAWGEEFGLQPNEATVGMILDALKKMGADYVFDTCFSADLTIMEEATEFIQRFTSGELKERPMFTSWLSWMGFDLQNPSSLIWSNIFLQQSHRSRCLVQL